MAWRPTAQNYALGFTVTFPVIDLAVDSGAGSGPIGDRSRAERARSQQIATDLRAQLESRRSPPWQGARRSAANTPVQVSAARAATEQATARYQSGLGNIDEVAEAQRLLDAGRDRRCAGAAGCLARRCWQLPTAAGDIQPFVAEASQ